MKIYPKSMEGKDDPANQKDSLRDRSEQELCLRLLLRGGYGEEA
jgi:hypothetical protein